MSEVFDSLHVGGEHLQHLVELLEDGLADTIHTYNYNNIKQSQHHSSRVLQHSRQTHALIRLPCPTLQTLILGTIITIVFVFFLFVPHFEAYSY